MVPILVFQAPEPKHQLAVIGSVVSCSGRNIPKVIVDMIE